MVAFFCFLSHNIMAMCINYVRQIIKKGCKENCNEDKEFVMQNCCAFMHVRLFWSWRECKGIR